MNQLNYAYTICISLLVEAIPFLLLGVLFSSLLLLLIDESNEHKLIAVLPRNPILGALVGSLIGCLFPVCECGNVPVARRLLMQGVPPPVAIGFLLAAPTVNPIVIWSTWTAFRDLPEIVVLRFVFSLGIATIIGWVFGVQKDLRPFLQSSVTRAMPKPQSAYDRRISYEGTTLTQTLDQPSPLLQSGTFLLDQPGVPIRLDTATLQTTLMSSRSDSGKSKWMQSIIKRLPMVLENMILELRELGGVLVLGSAIAAIIQVAVPRELILSLGQGPVTSIVAMLVLAAVVSICSTVDAFFALSFASTFTTGSLLAFLVFGPMIDLKAIGLLLWIFKGRAVVYLMLLAAQLTFVLTLAYNLKIG